MRHAEVVADRVLIQRVVWDENGPNLRMREAIGAPSTLVPVPDTRLGYRVDEPATRTCVGHVPFRKGRGDYVDCTNAPQPGSRVCERCAIVEATFASNLHHAHTRGSAELDPAIRKHLDQPNRLYLAGFRDGTIKVGTSTLSRADRRLQEQGAWQARFIAEATNGRLIRRLEDSVTEQLGIPQSVAASRKRRGLVTPIDDSRLASALSERAAQAIAAVIDPAAGNSVTMLDEAWRHPMADHPATERLIDYPLALERGRHDLELVTAVGRLLLARRPNGADVFVLDPAPLFGIWLEIGDFGSDEIAIQDSLF